MGDTFNAKDLIPDTDHMDTKTDTVAHIAGQSPLQQVHPLTQQIVHSKREHFTIGNMPTVITDILKQEIKDNNMSAREYIVHLMRQNGTDIPDIKFLNKNRKLNRFGE